jgi:C4-dicarboxylate transporter DctM subunit
MEIVIIASLLVVLFIFLEMPIAFCFWTGTLVYFLVTGNSMGSVVRDAFFSINNFALLAVPLFMIAGTLMEISGIAERLVNFSRALLKRFKGGMGAIVPVSSMFFGALSGSGTATVAALGSILIPRLTRIGWDRSYIAAMLAAAGPLGFMIPPNMSAILYGVVSNTSIASLFLATIVPGIMWGILYIIINRIVYNKWYTPPAGGEFGSQAAMETAAAAETAKNSDLLLNQGGDIGYWKDVYQTFKAGIPAFIMPVIIFGGIYGGVFTATEAGAVACAYAFLVGMFWFRTVNWANGYKAFTDTAASLASFMIILPMVIILTRILVINGVPQTITKGLSAISTDPNVLLFLIVLVLFIAGFFLDPGVLIFVLTPLMMPTANAIGLDPIQLGVILFVSIGVGALTPPMAMNLFVASRVSGVPMQQLIRPLLPFFVFGAIPILLLVTYVPALSLWLPNLVSGGR